MRLKIQFLITGEILSILMVPLVNLLIYKKWRPCAALGQSVNCETAEGRLGQEDARPNCLKYTYTKGKLGDKFEMLKIYMKAESADILNGREG